MKNEWTKTPKHILRFEALKYVVKDMKQGVFLEFGAGTGSFTKYFLDKEFEGTVYDIDDRTIDVLKNNLQSYHNVQVIETLENLPLKNYDYLFAFEVLEHIENDLEALKVWTGYLKKDGFLVVSVPAHQNKYSEEDKRVGHVRRYEMNELNNLFKEAGFTNIKIINYGFPLGNITRFVKNLLNKIRRKKNSNDSAIENSIKSGIERDDFENKFKIFFNPKLLMPFIFIQRLFFTNDFGDGYILIAQYKK